MAVDYRELTVWERAMRLAEHVYQVSRGFPADERFGMTAQVRRAAVSVPSCIAEGNARATTRDYLRFLSMSSGSLAELETQMLLARRLGYAQGVEFDELEHEIGDVMRLLKALRNSLESRVSEELPLFPVPCSLFPAS